MLHYISNIIPYAIPHSISLSLPDLPSDDARPQFVIPHFVGDENMLRYLIQRPGYFDTLYLSCDQIYKLMSTTPISVERCRQIVDSIGYDGTDYQWKILYYAYKLTGDIKYGNAIISHDRTHVVKDYITKPTIERVENCITEEQTNEAVFLYQHLSEEDKVALSNRNDLDTIIYSIELLRVMLPYYQQDINYLIAYTIVNSELTDNSVDIISPAQYFMLNISGRTTDKPINSEEFGFYEVLREYLTLENMPLLQDIMWRLDPNSEAFAQGKYHAKRVRGY